MRAILLFTFGLLTPYVLGKTIVSRADIETCLTSFGVPIDIKGTADWKRDAAPFNLRVPYIPVAISVPTTIEHIQKSVICATALGIKVSAKSGGHSYASFGLGGEDGHLVVELDRMYNVTMGEDDIAIVQPGVRLGHLATELATKYGRAVAHGTCPGVGISGHFLHGGFGFSSHTHGLALDAVVGATVVLADGSIVETSERQNPDLFWALRGAGSNFGIVASWRLKTFMAPTTLSWFSVSLGWNHSTAVAGLEALENYVTNAMPGELNFRLSDRSQGRPGMEGLYYGTEAQMRAAVIPLLEKAAPLGIITASGTVDWLQATVHYSHSDNVDRITPSTQETFFAKSLTLKGLHGNPAQNLVDYWFNNATQMTERNWWFQLDIHGGKNSAITRVSKDQTAYAHRDKLYIVQFYDRVSQGVYPPEGILFLNGWVDAVTSTLTPDDWGMYINYADTTLDRETAQRVYYGSNLRRLQEIKAKYDPMELFYYPQSIKPLLL
ncbi:Glucooligosaccharide oxidase [Parathielavia appendiculata]|uniref:Glucooligosaccharide oxidase n=1 Tax=Parathielavia appendiculata TaxID=2587402 RepID=A0AAN6TWF4_9PEZI|nr:Glucooligosaccharide oxidase [Parathielavia appendiculata]